MAEKKPKDDRVLFDLSLRYHPYAVKEWHSRTNHGLNKLKLRLEKHVADLQKQIASVQGEIDRRVAIAIPLEDDWREFESEFMDHSYGASEYKCPNAECELGCFTSRDMKCHRCDAEIRVQMLGSMAIIGHRVMVWRPKVKVPVEA